MTAAKRTRVPTTPNSGTGSSTASAAFPGINWPSLERAPYAPPLELIRRYQGVVEVPHLFSSQQCKAWLSFFASAATPVRLTPSPAAKRGEATRTNDRFSVQDAVFAERLFHESGLAEALVDEQEEGIGEFWVRGRKAIGLNSNIRIYRYEPGAFFDRKRD